MSDTDSNSSDSLTETIGGTRVAKSKVDTEYVFKIVVLGDYNVGKTTLIHRLLHTSLPSRHEHKHKHNHKDKNMRNKTKSSVNAAHDESSDDESKDEDSMTSDDKSININNNKVDPMDMEHISPTIGVDFFAKFISHIRPHINVRLQFWDTAGLTRYATLDNNLYRHASLILCVFDVTHKDSLEHIVSQHLVHAAEFIPELEQDKIIVVGNKLDLLHDNVNAFTELLNNYHRHRRPNAAFLTSNTSFSPHSNVANKNNHNNNNIIGNLNEHASKKQKDNAISTNEVGETNSINAVIEKENIENEILYSSSDDNTSSDETTNTNDNDENEIKNGTHAGISRQQRRQARLEAEARNAVVTEKDVYEYLLNDFDDIKYLTVSARSDINMSRLLELMCDVLLCQVTNTHHEKGKNGNVNEHESHLNVPVNYVEECVNEEQDNSKHNTKEENGRNNVNGNYNSKINNNKENTDLQSSKMPINSPVVVVQECDLTPHSNEYNVGCWSNNDALSFNLSPQEQTATFVESEDNLYSPQEGNDAKIAPEYKLQHTQCSNYSNHTNNNNNDNNSNNSNSENNNTSVSVTISATQLMESSLQTPENVILNNVVDTHDNIEKEISSDNKPQITNIKRNQDSNNVNNKGEEEEATCQNLENEANTFTNCTVNNAHAVPEAQLLESHQEPTSQTNSLLEKQDYEKEMALPQVSLLDQVAQEFEQQRQQTIDNNNNANNDDDGITLREELRDRFTAIEAESRERYEANKTKNCKSKNNSSTLTQHTVNNSHDDSSPVINVAQRYKKHKKHTCQCGSLPCTCM